MGRKKKVVENTAVNAEAVEKEIIETEKAVEKPAEKPAEKVVEKIESTRNNLIKVRMIASVSVNKYGEWETGQIVSIPDYIYNQISQSCVKV